MATATKPTPEVSEQDTGVVERYRKIRRSVLNKVTTPKPTKVDIRPVGPNRFRVNVWAETGGKTEGGFFNEKRIVETFYHVL
jgi:hypothetical protein